MIQTQYKMASSSDGLLLEVLECMPAKTPQAMVIFVHGMAEHKERYLDCMSFLSEKGLGCVIYDQRGHGASVRAPQDLGYFYEKNATYIVNDLHDMVLHVRKGYPGIPLYILGHSMGTLVCRLYLKQHDNFVDKMILTGPVVRNPLVGPALGLVKVLKLAYGDHHISKLIQNTAFGPYDKKFSGTLKNRWLSVNEQNVLEYNRNPLDGFIFTLNGFQNLFIMIRSCFDEKGWSMDHRELPILLLAGDQDPVIGDSQQFLKTVRHLQERGYQHVQYKLYSGLRHEILQETKKDAVFQDILQFLKD